SRVSQFEVMGHGRSSKSYLTLREASGTAFGATYEVSRKPLFVEARRGRDRQGAELGAGRGTIRAPMPGTVVSVLVSEGDAVEAHQPLAILEAMKMEHVMEAPHPGVVRSINARQGDMVLGDATLMEVDNQ
ncbi:MAG TPA: acetyl-CoA carboxylase biotin carboxyl carrier protein subunit, partial [Chloroflexota bacterium]|nr:acetyl-CoA carboxylase biotin carboxyl carrier protein subunit [Chloroflexota bacterium]